MLLKKGRGKGRADLLLAVTALRLVVSQLNVVLGETWFPTVQLGGSDEMPVCPTSEMESGHGGGCRPSFPNALVTAHIQAPPVLAGRRGQRLNWRFQMMSPTSGCRSACPLRAGLEVCTLACSLCSSPATREYLCVSFNIDTSEMESKEDTLQS